MHKHRVPQRDAVNSGAIKSNSVSTFQRRRRSSTAASTNLSLRVGPRIPSLTVELIVVERSLVHRSRSEHILALSTHFIVFPLPSVFLRPIRVLSLSVAHRRPLAVADQVLTFVSASINEGEGACAQLLLLLVVLLLPIVAALVHSLWHFFNF